MSINRAVTGPLSPGIFSCLFVFFVANVSGAELTYWQDVRPVLRRHCAACHNRRSVKDEDVSGGLSLDNYQAVLKGGKQPVVRVGKSAASELIRRVETPDTEKRMPLAADPLPPEQIALLRRWIDGGAPEGRRPDAAVTAAPATRRRIRKLDVKLPTAARAPKGVLGNATPGPLELDLRVGPLAPVAAVAFSPDGKLLASGAYGQVTVWDLATARPVQVLTSVLGAVNDLQFSPDGKLLAVAGGQPSAKGDLRLFHVGDWKLAATFPGHEDVVFAVAFSPDGQRLASASFDKTVRLWDVATHKLERTLTGHSDFVYSVAFGPDGKWLVSASKDRFVKLVDAATGKGRFTFSGMDQDVLAVAVRPDGKAVVSAGFEPALVWWNAQTGERTRSHPGHGGAVHEISFSADGKRLASASADRTVRLWDGGSGAPLRTLAVGSIVYAVRISPDGKRVASGSFDGLVRLWDVATGRQLLTLVAPPPHGGKPEWLALTPEGYAAGSPDLAQAGRWRVGNQAVKPDAAWKALGKPEVVARALRGQPVPAAFR